MYQLANRIARSLWRRFITSRSNCSAILFRKLMCYPRFCQQPAERCAAPLRHYYELCYSSRVLSLVVSLTWRAAFNNFLSFNEPFCLNLLNVVFTDALAYVDGDCSTNVLYASRLSYGAGTYSCYTLSDLFEVIEQRTKDLKN